MTHIPHLNKNHEPPTVRVINKLLANIVLAIRPFFGSIKCSFAIGCTTYAVIQLQEKPLVPALLSVAKRLLACTLPFVRSRL